MESIKITPVPEDFAIIDKQKIFLKKTFSGYKKTSVFTELNNCLIDSRIDNILYWTAEIHCSGYIDILWDKIFIFMSKNININNPELPTYIFKHYIYYSKILKKIRFDNKLLHLRNAQESRNQLFDIMITFALSKKISLPKIPKIFNQDFLLENIMYKLNAKNTHHIKKIMKNNDPKELLLPLNELIFNIQKKNMNDSIYWISWILSYEKYLAKSGKKITCSVRCIKDIEKKYYDDISWLIWNTIFYCCDQNKFTNQIKSIYQIYKINFTKSKKNTRIHLFIHAILLIIEKVDSTIPLKIKSKINTNNINEINNLYKKIQYDKLKDLKKNSENSLVENIILNHCPTNNSSHHTQNKNKKKKKKK